MISVLDTSAAIELVLGRPQSTKIMQTLSCSTLVVCPNLYSAEVTNVFWKLCKAEEISRSGCESAINRALSLVDDLIPMAELSQEVFAAAITYEMSAYDMYYAVTSRRYNALLLTIDKKLKETAKKMKLRI